MAKHQWSILCKKSIVDKDDNAITLFEVIEEVIYHPFVLEKANGDSTADAGLPIPKQKFNYIAFQLITLWSRTDPEKEEIENARVKVVSPENKTIFNQDYKVDLTKHVRTRSRLNFTGLPVLDSGLYSFKVQLQRKSKSNVKWITAADLEIRIRTADQKMFSSVKDEISKN